MNQDAGLFRLPPWTGPWLRIAAIYHILMGLDLLVAPSNIFELSGLSVPQPLFLAGLLGVMIFATGVGLIIAPRDIFRYWPVLLLVLSEKILGILCITAYLLLGLIEPAWIFFALIHSLLWIPPLIASLLAVLDREEIEHFEAEEIQFDADPEILSGFTDQNDASLTDILGRKDTLLVFLRHFGCTFCREAVEDLALSRKQIEESKQIVLVHLSPENKASSFLQSYQMDDVSRISDPQKGLYEHFGLKRAEFGQVFGWKSWVRGLSAGILRRHGVGKEENDGWQMPGLFVMKGNKVVRAYRHRSAADKPDYCKMAEDSAKVKVPENNQI